MITHSSLNDLCNMLQGRPILLGAVVAQSNVVGKAGLIACSGDGIVEELHRLCVPLLFPKKRTFKDLSFLGIRVALIQDASSKLCLLLLIGDRCLKHQHPFRVLRRFHCSASLIGFFIQSCLDEALDMIDLVFINVRHHLYHLAISICCIRKVLHVIVAIAQQGQSTTALGKELKLLIEDLHRLVILLLHDMGVDGFGHLPLLDLNSAHHGCKGFRVRLLPAT
mmetsp:Transcript_61281/g.97013  ORF Transcript_61281/g.97013 Transcript_61281/m.97013 type:complete len:223 (+) Transcript_61281:1438-2106(+)